MIKEDVLNKIEMAREGREIWLNLIKEKGISDGDYVILFPAAHDEWSYYGAFYLNEFLQSKSSERAVVLCHDDEIADCVTKHSKYAEAAHFPRESAEKLMAFYSLYMFTDNLIIFSPDEPAGRNGRSIVGVRGVTVEEVAVIGIYGLKKLKEPGKGE